MLKEPKIETPSTKARPILFSGPMVQAILDGRKTQTRRIVKPQPTGEFFGPKAYRPSVSNRSGDLQPGPEQFGIFDTCGEWSIRCPYGCPGDRLWVRETWMEFDADHRISDARYAYRASTTKDGEAMRQEYIKCGRKYQWRPSIFMPRDACRIHLEIRNVAVERLHEIDEEDAIAEGSSAAGQLTAVNRFTNLWVKINGEGSFDANPWVWVIEFRRV